MSVAFWKTERISLLPAHKQKGFSLRFVFMHVYTYVGRDGVVGIATRYGLDGPGIESR
jgi:hypothetical protein